MEEKTYIYQQNIHYFSFCTKTWQKKSNDMVTKFENRCVSQIYLIVLITVRMLQRGKSWAGTCHHSSGLCGSGTLCLRCWNYGQFFKWLIKKIKWLSSSATMSLTKFTYHTSSDSNMMTIRFDFCYEAFETIIIIYSQKWRMSLFFVSSWFNLVSLLF